MRKAFDANVPKLKPRLRPAGAASPAATLPLGEAIEAAETPTSTETATATATPAPTATRAETATPTPSPRLHSPLLHAAPAGWGQREGATARRTDDVLTRKDRLEKIKRRVAEASRPAPRAAPVPTDPARAAESVLGLVRELEGELGRAREREEAL